MKTDVGQRYMRDYMNARYTSRRQKAVTALGPTCCVEGCQETTDLSLSAKTKGKNFTRIFSLSDDKFMEELSHFELRCPKHPKSAPLKHYTYAAYYRHGCRCEECEEWHADYLLRRVEDRKKEPA